MGKQECLTVNPWNVFSLTHVMMQPGATKWSFGLDWFYFNWNQDWPEARNFHINEKEIVAVVLAA